MREKSAWQAACEAAKKMVNEKYECLSPSKVVELKRWEQKQSETMRRLKKLSDILQEKRRVILTNTAP